MPRTEANLPGRTIALGDPLDTIHGSDTKNPSGYIYPTQTAGSGEWTALRIGEPFLVVATWPTGGGKAAAPGVDIPMPPFKYKIIDVWARVNEADVAGSTIQLLKDTTAITAAIALHTIADDAVVRQASLAEATDELDGATGGAANTLNAITAATGAHVRAHTLFINCIRVK